ncbi:hypothetical protein [Nannocystis punicea]|uniref:Endo-1,4-beta-xylanase A n=1 Tax=Nannocystis punicea TaxID=2995304 RepID=A0ABY7GX48_9BACT|nr:hypothetical protein [Nannocystis poenicansa]WAS91522.1 hypothetical protein O0S08_35515 [Nannocystis poenicansa]
MLLASACGEDKDPLMTVGGSGMSGPSGGPSGDPSGGPSGDPSGPSSAGESTAGESTGAATTGEPTTGGDGADPFKTCQDYVNCIAVTTPNGLPDAQAGFGEGSACWSGTPADAELCGKACMTGLEQAHDMFPDEPACDPCNLGAVCTDTMGTFLLAIATPLGEEPFQFIVEGTLPVQDDGALSLTVRPLSLDMNAVTYPRQPVGQEYMWNDVPVAGGGFTIATGILTIPAEANPLFGVMVGVDAVMTGTVVSEDLFCGTVSGDVVLPVQQSIAGSTFAAVRVPSVGQLPTSVTIDCDGTTVSE